MVMYVLLIGYTTTQCGGTGCLAGIYGVARRMVQRANCVMVFQIINGKASWTNASLSFTLAHGQGVLYSTAKASMDDLCSGYFGKRVEII